MLNFEVEVSSKGDPISAEVSMLSDSTPLAYLVLSGPQVIPESFRVDLRKRIALDRTGIGPQEVQDLIQAILDSLQAPRRT